jgi:hypothetical protein
MAINIVPLHDRLLNTDLQSIKGEVFKSMTPQEMEIQINKVDQVERASSGKSQLVIRGF